MVNFIGFVHNLWHVNAYKLVIFVHEMCISAVPDYRKCDITCLPSVRNISDIRQLSKRHIFLSENISVMLLCKNKNKMLIFRLIRLNDMRVFVYQRTMEPAWLKFDGVVKESLLKSVVHWGPVMHIHVCASCNWVDIGSEKVFCPMAQKPLAEAMAIQY